MHSFTEHMVYQDSGHTKRKGSTSQNLFLTHTSHLYFASKKSSDCFHLSYLSYDNHVQAQPANYLQWIIRSAEELGFLPQW